MESTIKPGAVYNFNEGYSIPLTPQEFGALFSYFEGLVNSQEFQMSNRPVKETVTIMNLHQAVVKKLEDAIISGDAAEKIAE